MNDFGGRIASSSPEKNTKKDLSIDKIKVSSCYCCFFPFQYYPLAELRFFSLSLPSSCLSLIFFIGLNAFKDKFEKGEEELGRREKQILDLDIQLNSIKEAIQKVRKKNFFSFKLFFLPMIKNLRALLTKKK